MKIKSFTQAGFTLIEIMIVVAIVGLLAGIAIPNLLHARDRSKTNACISNLREIDSAKQQWALEKGQGVAAIPGESDIQPYIGRGEMGSLGRVWCPLAAPGPLSGYSINNVGILPKCNSEGGVHPAILQ